MNVAQLRFDQRAQKWIASYQGQVLIRSPRKDYVVNMIKEGRCTKANMRKVTDVKEIGVKDEPAPNAKVAAEVKAQMERFPINERFEFLGEFVSMVGERVSASLLVTGEGGIGKTHTVMATIRKLGLQDISDLLAVGGIGTTIDDRKFYTVIKGYSSAKGLYRLLWENRNRLVIFDDCDSVLKDATALNLLKSALDSYDKRVITWMAEAFSKEDDLPRSFEFKGGCIFISNLPLYKIDQAVRTRCTPIDLSMTAKQKIDRMRHIIKSSEFMPNYEIKHKEAALTLLEKLQDEAHELSIRTLMAVTKVAARGNDAGDWKRRAEYLITSAA